MILSARARPRGRHEHRGRRRRGRGGRCDAALVRRGRAPDPGALGQLVEFSRRETRACADRLLGVRSTRRSAAWRSASSARDGGVAQVEDVYTVAEARGRGFARALVTRAVELARDAGPRPDLHHRRRRRLAAGSSTPASASGRSAGSGSSTSADAGPVELTSACAPRPKRNFRARAGIEVPGSAQPGRQG